MTVSPKPHFFALAETLGRSMQDGGGQQLLIKSAEGRGFTAVVHSFPLGLL